MHKTKQVRFDQLLRAMISQSAPLESLPLDADLESSDAADDAKALDVVFEAVQAG